VDDIGRPKVSNEAGPVTKLSHDGSGVFETGQMAERARRERVDRDETRVNDGIVPPGPQKSIRLDRLAAENAQRWRNERDAQTLRARHGRATVQTTRPSTDLLQRTAGMPAVRARILKVFGKRTGPYPASFAFSRRFYGLKVTLTKA
jgi:hypothetical protein